MIFLSEGAAAERGFVLMWRQEWALVNKAYNALYRAQGLYEVVAALMRVPAVPADFDRLISSGRLIHVALYKPHLRTKKKKKPTGFLKHVTQDQKCCKNI